MLEIYRQKIDIIDNEIILLLAKRFEVIKEIGIYKKQNNLPIYQSDRREQLLNSRQEQAKKSGLSPIFIKDLRTRIHQESLDIQNLDG